MIENAIFLRRHHGAIATGTFNHAASRNALSAEMLSQFRAFLTAAKADESIRCVVLTGAGDHFVSGGDVKNFAKSADLSPDDRKIAFEKRVLASYDLFSSLHHFPKPVIAATKGACAGAGLSIIMASDFVLAREDSFFVCGHTHLGISLDIGVSYYLPRLVGLRNAKKIAYFGRPMNAQEALDLGLVTAVHSAETLESETEALSSRIAQLSPQAISEMKTLLTKSYDQTYEQQYKDEAEAVGRCAATSDFLEGVSAFVEKRKPQF